MAKRKRSGYVDVHVWLPVVVYEGLGKMALEDERSVNAEVVVLLKKIVEGRHDKD
jgi:hypothetical protein